MNRPEPYGEPPEGYEWVAEVNPDWRLVTGKLCRRQGKGHRLCRQEAVAEVAREQTTSYAKADLRTRTVWWPYCPEHMYGNWIENGQVTHWVLRRIGGAS